MANMTRKKYMKKANKKTHDECEVYKVNDKDIYINVNVGTFEELPYIEYRDIYTVKINGVEYESLDDEIDDDFLEDLAFEAIPNYEENKVNYNEFFAKNVTNRILKSEFVTQLPCEQCPWHNKCLRLKLLVTNEYIIKDKLKEYNKVIGCFDRKIEYLNENNMNKILEALEFGGDTDVTVFLHRKKHVVEIVTTSSDNEVDFYMSTLEEYNYKYGY